MFNFSKHRVGRSFDRGAARYDRHANVQSKIVHDVIDVLSQRILSSIERDGRIIDLGCGTGKLLSLVRDCLPEATLMGLDLSTAMLGQVETRRLNPGALLTVDLEMTYLRDKSVDLILSSSALQWANLVSAGYEMQRILKPGGYVVAAHIVDGSLQRWRDLWGLNAQQLHDFGALSAQLLDCGFEVVHTEKRVYQERPGSFDECLDKVRGIGAGQTLGGKLGLGGKSRLIKAKNAVETEIANQGGYNMNYITELVIAKKVGS